MKYLGIMAYFFVCLLSPVVWAGENITDINSRNKPAVHKLVWSVARGQSVDLQYDRIFFIAMELISEVFKASLDIKTDAQAKDIRGLDFLIRIDTVEALQKDMNSHRAKGYILSKEIDGYTVLLNTQSGEFPVTNVMIEEIMSTETNGHRTERPLAFPRLLVVLGHEIFGNVIPFIESKGGIGRGTLRHRQLLKEVGAYTAGIVFINKMIAWPKLPDTTKRGLEILRVEEAERLKSWRLALETEFPAMVTPLKSNNKVTCVKSVK